MEERAWLADASSLIYIAKCNAFEAMNRCMGVLAVPPGVWKEAVEHGERIGAGEVPRIRLAVKAGFVIRVGLPSRAERLAKVIASEQRLGRGESEVLALTRPGDPCLIDEGRASRVASDRRLRPLSTILVPVLGARRGRIGVDEARELIRCLGAAANATAQVLLAAERELVGGNHED